MPTPSIRWLKDGDPIEGDNIEQSGGRGPTHWLVIRSIKSSDAGKYSCIAENAKGTAWCAVKLSVQSDSLFDIPEVFQQAPLFTAKPKSSRVASRTDCLLRCAVRGQPTPHVTWYKDGSRINSASGRYLLDSKGHGIHTLKVTDVNITDQGIYSVIAESSAGEASCSATIDIYDLEPVSEQFKPVVTFGTASEPARIARKSVTVTAGKTARLTLEVNGQPLPEVTWYKNGVKIYQGKRFSEGV